MAYHLADRGKPGFLSRELHVFQALFFQTLKRIRGGARFISPAS